MKRPLETNVSFSVHSLLVVDAVQTLGTDFELLIASHRNLCLDSQSGSILDSQPNSPSSPQSPNNQSASSPQSPSASSSDLTRAAVSGNPLNTWQNVASALQSLVSPTTSYLAWNASRPETYPGSTETRHRSFHPGPTAQDDEALIRVEFDIIKIDESKYDDSIDDTLYIAIVEFNSLDVIANQQTIVELATFFRQIFPSEVSASQIGQSGLSGNKTNSGDVESKMADVRDAGVVPRARSRVRQELVAHFHRLNVLLMRVTDAPGPGGGKIARKVATATLSEANIQLTLTQSLKVEGSLCGFELLDLTPEGSRHQQVLSVGVVPIPIKDSLSQSLGRDDSENAMDASSFASMSSSEKAFNFSLTRPFGDEGDDAVRSSTSKIVVAEEVVLVLRLASVRYLHAPNLLRELSLCGTEFKEYVARISRSLKEAATELAMGLISKGHGAQGGGPVADVFGISRYGSEGSLDAGRTTRYVGLLY